MKNEKKEQEQKEVEEEEEKEECVKLGFKQVRGWNEQMLEVSKRKLAEDHRIIKELDLSSWLEAQQTSMFWLLEYCISFYWLELEIHLVISKRMWTNTGFG